MASFLSSLPPPRRSVGPASVHGANRKLSHQAGEDSDQEHQPQQQEEETTTVVARKQAAAPTATTVAVVQPRAPSYEERCRAAAQHRQQNNNNNKKERLFVPRSLQDFDDGGAFPEIHVAQYPRHMGNPHVQKRTTTTTATNTTTTTTGGKAGNKSKRGSVNGDGDGDGEDNAHGGSHTVGGTVATVSRALVNVQVDKNGEVSYDAIVKGGTNADKLVYTRHQDLRGGPPANPQDIALPTPQEEEEEAAKTQAALQALLAQKTELDKPSGSAMVHAETSKNIEAKTQFIHYTPRTDAPGYNPAAAQRVIQMVPAKVDPMMPPKHRHIKAPRGPAEDPVPVLQAPPTKLSKEERAAWNVPACISNWKNMRGYTIPLDKRLAADGRGLMEAPTVNPQFATLSESLYVAERQARQEVRMRAQVQKKLALAEKEQRETELRRLAQQARLERGGAVAAATNRHADDDDDDDDDFERHDDDEDPVVPTRADDEARETGGRQGNRIENDGDEDDHQDNDGDVKPRADETEEEVAARQRERLRVERKRQRERELRLERNMEHKKKKLEAERDVSEKMALGVHTGHAGNTGDGLAGEVDARLYNQSAGMDSGFGADDEYNVYSKPLFAAGAAAGGGSLYRPTRGETAYNADEQYDQLQQGATTKFQPGRGFAGAEPGNATAAPPRTAPVQFEKDSQQPK